MDQSAKYIAENASFQAFINSYLREAHVGDWIAKEEWVKENRPGVLLTGEDIVVFELPHQSISIAIEVHYRSLVGRHLFGASLKRSTNGKVWNKEDRLTLMIALIQELNLMEESVGCREAISHYDELLLRLIESYQTMEMYVEKRMEDFERLYSENSTFIETEQSLLFGHWLHPTPKSRQGMANWQHLSFAPELAGHFKLHYFQIDRKMVNQSPVLKESANDIILQSYPKFLTQSSEDTCIIPMHPLQAQWLLQQDYVKKAVDAGSIKDLGAIGSLFSATSSLRTVYNAEENWMYKFSIPVKVTNSLRMNRHHELKAGVVMAGLLEKIPFQKKYSTFHIIDDPAYLTVDFPGQRESGFEVIIRANLFPKGKDKGISSVAAIVQDPLPNRRSRLSNLILKLADIESRPIEKVSIDWFKKYWSCAIEPLIRLYDEHGIALEAHQQNSVLDISSGYPESYYYRDNQGYYLSKRYEKELLFIEPSLTKTPELFYDDNLIQDRFTYYLLMNQLFSIIYRFGADRLINEETLIEWSIKQLQSLEKDLTGQGKVFVHTILNQEKLAYKANLLTRFHNVDELTTDLEQAVYTKIPNPFVLHHREEEYAQTLSFIL